ALGAHLDGARYELDAAGGLLVSGDLALPSAARVHVEGRASRASVSFAGELGELSGETGATGTLALLEAGPPRATGTLAVAGTPVAHGALALDGTDLGADLDLVCGTTGFEGRVRAAVHCAAD